MTADVKVTITAIISNSDPIAIFFSFSSSYHLKITKQKQMYIIVTKYCMLVVTLSLYMKRKRKKVY